MKASQQILTQYMINQLGKLSNLLDAASLPKGGNKTEFDNNLGLFKKALSHAQNSFSSKTEGA